MTRCKAHLRGVTPGARPFYTPGCPVCERKRAAGVVSAELPSAPLPFQFNHKQWGRLQFGPLRTRQRAR